MTITIPNGLFEKYVEAVDFFLTNDNLSNLCTLVYPPKRTSCINCSVKMVGSSSLNTYKHGGPAPFTFGSCPLCGGNGYSETEYTEDIRLRVYWNRKDWLKVTNWTANIGTLGFEDANIAIIGFMSNLPKVKQAIELRLVKNNLESAYRATLAGKPSPWGFGKNRYFVALLKGL